MCLPAPLPATNPHPLLEYGFHTGGNGFHAGSVGLVRVRIKSVSFAVLHKTALRQCIVLLQDKVIYCRT